MNQRYLDNWLKETAWDKPYWSDVHAVAMALKADGCSGVPDSFVWTCLEHDCHYRTHKLLNGMKLTKREADYILRVRVQQTDMSILKWPVSWVRWLGVAVIFKSVSQRAWKDMGGAGKLHNG